MELPGRGDGTQPLTRATAALGLYTCFALLGILIAGLRGDWDIYFLAGVTSPAQMVLSPIVGLVVGLAVVFFTRLSVHRFDWARHLHRVFRGLLHGSTARDVFILAGASAVGEEILFRGALQPWIGLWPTAIIFSLLHIGPGLRFLAWTALALAMGLVFGLMARWLGDLSGSIVAHFVINLLNIDYILRVELPE
jgi:hypothetical protein